MDDSFMEELSEEPVVEEEPVAIEPVVKPVKAKKRAGNPKAKRLESGRIVFD